MDTGSIEFLRWQDWAGHASYLILAFSYLVTSMLWLRLLTLVGLTLESAYFFLGSDSPLWVGMGWNGTFFLINVVQVGLLLHAHARTRLGEEERLLHQGLFADLEPVEFKRLVATGHWSELSAGALLTRQGEPVDRLRVLTRGLAQVEVDGKPIALLQPGAFVGEMSLIAGVGASATVTALEPVRVFELPRQSLERLLDRDEGLRGAMHRAIGRDLVQKLRNSGRQPS